MINTNLILIDGIIGSGKSTTAQRIFLYLTKHGYDADWFSEVEVPHPVNVEASQIDPEKPEQMMEQVHLNWEKLVTNLINTKKIIVLESSIFQTFVGGLQFMEIDDDKIISNFLKIQEMIKALNPVLIYFYQNDLAQALTRLSSLRGAEWENYLISWISHTPYGKTCNIQSFNEIIKYYQKHRKITDSLFNQLTIKKLSIDNSAEDWDCYYRQMAVFLSLANLDCASTPLNDLGDFVGLYREVISNHEWRIVSDGICLYFDDSYQKRLVHKVDNIFYVEAMCLELSFETNEKGIIAQIKCYGNEAGQEAVGTVWIKVE